MKEWVIYISLVYTFWGGISPGYGSDSGPQWFETKSWDAFLTILGAGWVAEVTDSARRSFFAESPAIETRELFKVYSQIDPSDSKAEAVDYGYLVERYLQLLGDVIDIGHGTLVVDTDRALGPAAGAWSVTLRLMVDDLPVEDAFVIFDFEDQRLIRLGAQMLHVVKVETHPTLAVDEVRRLVEANLPETAVADQWLAEPSRSIAPLPSPAPSGFDDRLVYNQAFISYSGKEPGLYRVKSDAHTGEMLLLTFEPLPKVLGVKNESEKSLSAISFRFRHPLAGSGSLSETRRYGVCYSGIGYHTGIDIPAGTGTPVRSATWGEMARRTYNGTQGNMGNTHNNRYLLDDGTYIFDLAAHLNSHHGLSSRPSGDTFIPQMAKIGEVGSTGGSWGPHLHYEVKEADVISNPYLPSGTITNFCSHPQDWARIYWGYTPMHPDYFGYKGPSSYINSRSVLIPEFSTSNSGWGDFDVVYGTAGSQVYSRLQTQNAGTLNVLRVRARRGFTGSSYDFGSLTNVWGSVTYTKSQTFLAGDYTVFPEVQVGSETRTGYKVIFSVLSSANDAIRDNDMSSTYFRSGGLGTARYDGYGYGAYAATGNSHAWAQWYLRRSGRFRVYVYVGGNGSGSARYKIYPSGSSPVQTDPVSFQQTYRWVPLNVNGSNVFDFTSGGYVGLSADNGSSADVYLFDAVKFEYAGTGGGGSTPQVTSPASGTTWQRGLSYTIQWRGFNDSSVSIYLYRGSAYEKTIASSTNNDGSYNWTIPSTLSTRSDYRILIRSTSNASQSGYSGTFVIGSSSSSMTTLVVNGSSTTGNITFSGGVDWYRFQVSTPDYHTVETWAGTLSDNYMYLYGPNSQTNLLETDDDDGSGFAAKIVRNLTTGIYYVKIRAYSSSHTGSYSIRVTR